jgi:hypothetical protein
VSPKDSHEAERMVDRESLYCFLGVRLKFKVNLVIFGVVAGQG